MNKKIFKHFRSSKPFEEDPIVFILPESSVQAVATKLLGRKLTDQEISFAMEAFYTGKHPLIAMNEAVHCAVQTAQRMSEGNTDSNYFLAEEDIDKFVREYNTSIVRKDEENPEDPTIWAVETNSLQFYSQEYYDKKLTNSELEGIHTFMFEDPFIAFDLLDKILEKLWGKDKATVLRQKATKIRRASYDQQ